MKTPKLLQELKEWDGFELLALAVVVVTLVSGFLFIITGGSGARHSHRSYYTED